MDSRQQYEIISSRSIDDGEDAPAVEAVSFRSQLTRQAANVQLIDFEDSNPSRGIPVLVDRVIANPTQRANADNNRLQRMLLISFASSCFYLSSTSFAICFLVKNVLLPIVLIDLFGGPLFIVAPWSMFLMIGGVILCHLCCYPMKNESSAKNNWVDHASGILTIISFQTGNFSHHLFVRSESEFLISSWLVTLIFLWCLGDFILTCITLGICLVIVLIFFVDVDGLIVVGWYHSYKIAIAEIVVCVISMFCSMVIVISANIVRCFSPSQPASENVSEICLSGYMILMI